MGNKKIILDELKDLYEDEYIFDDIAHFADTYKYEKEDSEIGRVYHHLSKDEQIEILEEYIRYRKNERANLRIRKDYKKY